MKKRISAILILVGMLSGLAACGGSKGPEIETYMVTEEPATNKNGEEITTDMTETEYFTDENGEVLRYDENGETEYVTIVAPSIEEMSPVSMDVTMPYEIEYQLTELKTLKVIDPKDSVYPDTNADIVYEKGNSQYFYYNNGELVVITMNKDKIKFACFYNSDGKIRFCSDDTMSWYFDGDKNIKHIVYTYYNAFSEKYVYTFYSAEGKRMYIGIDGIYYNNSLDQLEGKDYENFIFEYSDTQEVVG